MNIDDELFRQPGCPGENLKALRPILAMAKYQSRGGRINLSNESRDAVGSTALLKRSEL